ncbi:MAG: S-layer homology domain-containing protein [Chloroflexia bacterium]
MKAVGRVRQHARDTLALSLLCLVLLLSSLVAFGGVAQADELSRRYEAGETELLKAGETPEVATTSPTIALPTATATEIIEPTATVGWEEQSLLALADRLGWPASVTIDGTGMYLVQLVLSERDWAQASIRPFAYEPSAEAAFAAEQEDARLSGLDVEPTTFYTYPAYSAVFRMPDGSVVERRLRWHVDKWIFGVSLHGTSGPIAALGTEDIGRELLMLAIEHGLPPPQGGILPTPLPPTHGATPSATATPVDCDLDFPDVTPQYWAYRYIMELGCAGIVSGYDDGSFRPDNPTTRAQISKMIVLSEDWALLNPAEPSFTDVGRSHIFYRYIETAYAQGILSGYPNRLFKPNSYVTRAQVAKMLVRARSWPLSLLGQAPVPLCDVPTNHWAWTYVQVAIQRRAFNGYANGCFLPDASATRAQIAKVLALAHR